MPDPGLPTVEAALQQTETRWMFLTPRQLSEGWRAAFDDAADAVPRPFWLYAADERTPLVLGFPVLASHAWESLCRGLGALIDDEAAALDAESHASGTAVDRSGLVQRLAGMVENALVNSHGRHFAEVFWLAFSRETATRIAEAVRSRATRSPAMPLPAQFDLRYALARRVADVANRAEAEAIARLRSSDGVEIRPDTKSFARLIREDLMPFAERRLTLDLVQLDAYLKAVRGGDPERLRRTIYTLGEKIDRLLQRDPAFANALRMVDPEAEKLSTEARLFAPAVLDLLATWNHPEAPHIDGETAALLHDTGKVLQRFEVIVALRERIFAVTVEGTHATARIRRQPVGLSSFTRPFDFASPGVVDSAVRRFGLLYDLVEFTALLEALRRQGRTAEDRGLRFMAEFHRAIDGIRGRRRLRFEKFLGDGAFYTARSATAVLAAAAELRTTYETLKSRGFPFSRGLRIAVNVGTYHLLPLASEDADHPHFEFFGHSLVELARLTSGKTTHEVEDIADFLIASGYDVHRVLEFLEPVRSAPRRADLLRERPYGAHLAENGELVNLGVVITEALLRDLERELGDVTLRVATHATLSWVLVPLDAAHPEGPLAGLRYIGTARLKGLEPTPLAELVVLDSVPPDAKPLPSGVSIVTALYEVVGSDRSAAPEHAELVATIPSTLCVASVLENPQVRSWFMGLYDAAQGALTSAFQVPLHTVELKDGEPFEVWLYRRRGELAMLYQGLLRHETGTTVALADLRERDGYFTCLLEAPHRSPR